MYYYYMGTELAVAKGEKGEYIVSITIAKDGCYDVSIAPLKPGIQKAYGWSQLHESGGDELVKDVIEHFEKYPPDSRKCKLI